jgi:preprotein translocase subunit SecD
MVTLPFSEQEAKDLEIVLNSGPYPVKMNILEVSNIAQSK